MKKIIKLIIHIFRKCIIPMKPIKENIEKEIFILGNGPSINNLNFKKIKKNVCCVNAFPIRNKNFDYIKPKYLCLADPIYFDEALYSNEEFELLKKINSIDWTMYIICPLNYKNKLKIDNKNIKFIYVDIFKSNFNTNVIKYYLYDKNIIGAGAQTVIVCALYYFLYSNSSKIYLCGVDMSEFKNYYVDDRNNIYRTNSHFYKNKKNKDYISFVKKGEFNKCLSLYCEMFNEFYDLSNYAKYKGIEVINTSIDSYIDVFKKTNEYNKK